MKISSPTWGPTLWAPCLLGIGSLILSGCNSSEGKEALHTGAYSPVKVTLLTVGKSGDGEEVASPEAEGPKIEQFGTFRGRVVVQGTPPNLAPLVAQGQPVKDAICSLNAVPNQSAEVGSNGGLANVFVFLRRVPNVDVPAPPTEPVTLDQKGCKFVPHASIIRVGQPLHLINSDPVAHNVKIVGTATSINPTLSPGDTTGVEAEYARAERQPIPVVCDFHGWMQAYQLAVDHPWAALTSETGEFVIEGAPAGKMEFVVWHEKLGLIERSFAVEIPPDGVVEQTFNVNAAALAAQ